MSTVLQTPKKLSYDFYNRNAVDVAHDLIGKKLVIGLHEGIITETEAYRGRDDEASHAYKGLTKRNAWMFGPPGHLYIYFIYGIYYCMNIVTEEVGVGSAVLIRGIQLPGVHLNGPGKICRYFGITLAQQGMTLLENEMCFVSEEDVIGLVRATPRIGITKATDKLWRFVLTAP